MLYPRVAPAPPVAEYPDSYWRSLFYFNVYRLIVAAMLLGIVAYASLFDFGYDPGPEAYALGSFWPTFILSALIVMGNPISFGAFLGDWSRYIPAGTPTSRLMLSAPTRMPATKTAAATTPSGCSSASIAITMPV